MLGSLWFYPVYGVMLVFTLLPLRLQLVMSDVLFFLFYHVAGYRKKTVYLNLRASFPEKSDAEIRRIAKGYYHHLCDYIIESMSLSRFGKKEAMKRLTYKNPEVLLDLHKQGKSVLLAFGHYAQWEWLANLPLIFPFQALALYKPLSNRHVDRFFIRLRERFGLKTLPMATSLRSILGYHEQKTQTLTLFLTDQRPARDHIEYWTRFLGQDTPVQLGIEKIARKLGYAVVFMKMTKKRRGYYEAEFITLTEKPAQTRPFGITEAHTRALEQQIREKPEYWLWSHKRWKYTREEIREDKGYSGRKRAGTPSAA